MFVFEGAAYDVVAAVIGAALGAVVAYGMVIVIASAFGAEDSDAGLQVEYAVAWRSLVVAFAIGVLLTLVVVAVSAWRVSVMTISTAIRNLPEPPSSKKSRRWILAVLGLALGAFIAMSGAAADAATALMLGISLVVISLVPILRLLGASSGSHTRPVAWHLLCSCSCRGRSGRPCSARSRWTSRRGSSPAS